MSNCGCPALPDPDSPEDELAPPGKGPPLCEKDGYPAGKWVEKPCMLDMARAVVHGVNYCRNIYISTSGWPAGYVPAPSLTCVAGVTVH